MRRSNSSVESCGGYWSSFSAPTYFFVRKRGLTRAPSAFAFASPSHYRGDVKAKVDGAAPFCRARAKPGLVRFHPQIPVRNQKKELLVFAKWLRDKLIELAKPLQGGNHLKTIRKVFERHRLSLWTFGAHWTRNPLEGWAGKL